MADTIKIILLADDDPEDQEILEEEILKLDPTVALKKVDSGKQAVNYLLNCPDSQLPCLIILDYSMPVYNAAEVLDQVRGQPLLQHIPKVVWSSSKQPEFVQACKQKGAAEYFVKPNKLSELTKMAKRMLSLCLPANGKINHE